LAHHELLLLQVLLLHWWCWGSLCGSLSTSVSQACWLGRNEKVNWLQIWQNLRYWNPHEAYVSCQQHWHILAENACLNRRMNQYTLLLYSKFTWRTWRKIQISVMNVSQCSLL
jgi:hypothetical protein